MKAVQRSCAYGFVRAACVLAAAGFWAGESRSALAQCGGCVFPGASWPQRAPEAVGMDASRLEAFSAGFGGSGCVIKDGYLVYSWGSPSARHNWASASKPCLSMMLFAAIHEGKVESVDAPISAWWGEALRPADRGITFRHLADMTSGYACPEEPGQAWAYNDYAIMLYMATLDKVFNSTDHLVTAGNQRFRDPLQFEDGVLFESGKGRVRASARDFARLGWFWLNRGRWRDQQLLPARFFDEYVMKADVPADLPMTRARNKEPDDYLGVGSYGGGVNQGDGQGIYGFNWWYNTNHQPSRQTWPSAPPDTYLALGRAGKDGMAIFPSLKLVVAAYNDKTPSWGDAIAADPPDPNSTLNLNLKQLVESVNSKDTREGALSARLVSSTSKPSRASSASPGDPVGRPLSLHPDNPHYLLFRGKPIIPITSAEHYGAVLNLDFDYVPYLDELHSKGMTHTRTFSGTYREVPASFGITDNTLAPRPMRYLAPWARSAQPGYFDGGNKFDLTKWDEAYFRRLKDFVAQASRRGIIVEINLFCPLYEEVLWDANPMNARNNVNGVGTCPRGEVYTLKHRDLLDVHKAVTRRIVQALREFDNIYYEICNEAWIGGVGDDWQSVIAATIAEEEPPPGPKHLISLNPSKKQISNPDPNVSIYNFHYPAPPDVVAMNYGLNLVIGDNETGFRGRENFQYRSEGWDFILAGGGLFSSLDYSFTPAHPDGSFLDYQSPGGGNATLRSQLRILKDFIHGFDFLRMKPDSTVIGAGLPATMTARAFAEPGRAYAIYARRRHDTDRFSVRWSGFLTAAESGTYTLSTVTNVGVRLWVDDQPVIDNARSHEKTEDRHELKLEAGRRVKLRMHGYLCRQGTLVQLMWSGPGTQKSIVPRTALTHSGGDDNGLRGEYFEDRKLEKLMLNRIDPVVDFDWSKATPFLADERELRVALKLNVPAGSWSAEWIDPAGTKKYPVEKMAHAGSEITLSSPMFTEDIALRILRSD